MKKVLIIDGIIVFCLAVLLVYTRFVGLHWGLPYPMHPDERNIVIAILGLHCSDIASTNCLHPNFFAYGQFSIYLGSILAHIYAFLTTFSWQITYEHATLALRFISASASVVTAYLLARMVRILMEDIQKHLHYLAFIIFIFVPGFIQFSHFGTTESLLMMFYTALLYISLRYLRYDLSLRDFVSWSGAMLGIALGTKVSALIFVAIPMGALLFKLCEGLRIRSFLKLIFSGIQIVTIALVFFVITSPYNLISWSDFMGSMNYESSVGLGTYKAFYTRQFEYTLPFLFQFIKVLPYTLGGPLFFITILAFIFLPFTKIYNFLRFQIIFFIIPTAIIYAKWARFLSPIFPVLALLGTVYLVSLLNKSLDKKTRVITTVIGGLIVFLVAIPGLAYTTIYKSPDVRFIASQWIYKNIPSGAYILSETANVVDTPIPSNVVSPDEYMGKTYRYISFNHYDLDQESSLQAEYVTHRNNAEYIFVPSRRVFYNHTCYRPHGNSMMKVGSLAGYNSDVCKFYETRYPYLDAYYTGLFGKESQYYKVAEFSSYPRIELFGRTFISLPDENAEETWSVFDHPVIRIYKKTAL